MSRVANNPIALPKGVEVTLGGAVSVKGPLGAMSQAMSTDVSVALNDGVLTFAPTSESIQANAMAGTMRALVNNMVQGVSKGFEKKLLLVGVGYRAQAQGEPQLTLGFSILLCTRCPPASWLKPDAERDCDQGHRSSVVQWPPSCAHTSAGALSRARVTL